MKKTSLAFILMAFFCIQVKAQIKLGVKAGVSASNIRLSSSEGSEDLNEYQTPLLGYQFGLTASYDLTERFSLQSAVLYSSKGNSDDLEKVLEGQQFVNLEGYRRARLNYIEVPVLATFKLTDNLQLHAGPYVAYGISGKSKADYSYTLRIANNDLNITEGYEEDIKPHAGTLTQEEENSDEEYFRAFDYGLNAGVGYQFGNILLSAEYSLGLGNIAAIYNENTVDAYNRGITLSVGYTFGN